MNSKPDMPHAVTLHCCIPGPVLHLHPTAKGVRQFCHWPMNRSKSMLVSPQVGQGDIEQEETSALVSRLPRPSFIPPLAREVSGKKGEKISHWPKLAPRFEWTGSRKVENVEKLQEKKGGKERRGKEQLVGDTGQQLRSCLSDGTAKTITA
uniref:Uncharacterized protein n=1 Tax=Coccidioides posadasii RMSCC 3488 TaxID=454284 RepID=A0A0J6IDG4_COCPO|nr:hypothetical protein CPAG_06086 [Coccidioides posadasii RMSCC 3488]